MVKETMTPVLVSSLEEAERLLAAGLVKHVELGFELTSDEFFHFASYWCERGAQIKKNHQHFVVSLKKYTLPPNQT